MPTNAEPHRSSARQRRCRATWLFIGVLALAPLTSCGSSGSPFSGSGTGKVYIFNAAFSGCEVTKIIVDPEKGSIKEHNVLIRPGEGETIGVPAGILDLTVIGPCGSEEYLDIQVHKDSTYEISNWL